MGPAGGTKPPFGGSDAASRLRYGFRLVNSRAPAEDEVQILNDVLVKQLQTFQADKDAAGKLLSVGAFKAKDGLDAAELAAYTTVAGLILNLDEAVTKN